MPTYLETPHSYSAAVQAGDFILLGLHGSSSGDFATQLHKTIAAIETDLKTFDRALEDLVKINVYLKDIKDLPEMERLLGAVFSKGRYPARMTSTTAFHDPDCLVMIDGTACAKDGM